LTLFIKSESSISCIASILNSEKSNDKNVIFLNYWMIADASDFIRDLIEMTTKSESHLDSLAFCNNSDDETSSFNNEFIDVITQAQRARFFAIEKTMITSQFTEILVTRKTFISQQDNEAVRDIVVSSSILASSLLMLRVVLLTLQESDQLIQRIRSHVYQASMKRNIDTTLDFEILKETRVFILDESSTFTMKDIHEQNATTSLSQRTHDASLLKWDI
jgi:vacuolar-type H+-ATPase catalytic subunit A/Vma1